MLLNFENGKFSAGYKALTNLYNNVDLVVKAHAFIIIFFIVIPILIGFLDLPPH